ncbi:hypothetical protein C2S51_010079 [Perilla frutescens var. frutescens]|nr:hypothetical protein C2S51_010079 [Perilla frutescens var. frutescens]
MEIDPPFKKNPATADDWRKALNKGSAYTGPPLTSAEALVAIHDISPEKDCLSLKKGAATLPLDPGSCSLAILLISNTPAMEAQLNVDFVEIYAQSELYRNPAPGSEDLHFPTKYAQSFSTKRKACFWKQHSSSWRNTQCRSKQQDLTNLLGAMHFAMMFYICCSISLSSRKNCVPL